MKPRSPIIKADGEIRNLSAADMKLFKPAKEVLEPELYKELVAMNKAARGRPRLEKPKQAIKLRLDVEIIEAFKSTGEGWQTRINALLKKEAKKISHA
ncbi:MAG: BrnA antitoxin family protein [Polynucleobacter sp.]|jgi:uncharacterized protein (DUF4415 family)|nr:BrnA antitoxin family protein [Polynucleobacter sp.]